MKKKAVEELADDGDLAGAELAKAKNKFLNQVRLKTHDWQINFANFKLIEW